MAIGKPKSESAKAPNQVSDTVSSAPGRDDTNGLLYFPLSSHPLPRIGDGMTGVRTFLKARTRSAVGFLGGPSGTAGVPSSAGERECQQRLGKLRTSSKQRHWQEP